MSTLPLHPSNPSQDPTLPRILALHGGGTNAKILRAQARTFTSLLSPHYRLVFADAPFECGPHPAILGVYGEEGPFRCWYRWGRWMRRCGGRAPVGRVEVGGEGEGQERDDFGDSLRDDDQVILAAMEAQLEAAMAEDDEAGGRGEWVGLLGFSQGARVAGSILYDRQLRMQAKGLDTPGFAGGRWKFAVLIAGRGPFVEMGEVGRGSGLTRPVGVLPDVGSALPAPVNGVDGYADEGTSPKMHLPTLHVHGIQDDGLPHMRHWSKTQFEEGRKGEGSTAQVVEWEGNHRLPFRSVDVEPMVDMIRNMHLHSEKSDLSEDAWRETVARP